MGTCTQGDPLSYIPLTLYPDNGDSRKDSGLLGNPNVGALGAHRLIAPLKWTEYGASGDLVMFLGETIFSILKGDYVPTNHDP